MKVTQLHKNFISNILALIANVVVGILYTPYLIRSLGVAAYGILPLTLVINQYISVLTGSLSGALTRFYSIALQRNDTERASKCLSTIMGVFIISIIILFPVLFVFIDHLEDLFNLPIDQFRSAKFLFLFTICSLFTSLFSSSLNVTLYAENKLDLMNWLKIGRTCLKFVLAILFFSFLDKNVVYIGVANLITEILVLLFSYILFRQSRNNHITIKISLFDKTLLVSIWGMALWPIIHQMGDVGIYRIDNIIVNNSFGISDSGTLGAVSEFGVYVGLVVSVIGSLYGPIILKAYAKGEHDKVQNIVLNNSLIVGSLSAIMCGIMMGMASNVLTCWLGSSFSEYDRWLTLKLLPLPFFAAAGIYAFSNRACNIVRYPAIITVMMGILNVGILWFISHFVSKKEMNTIDIISLMLCFSSFIVIIQSFTLNSIFFLKTYPDSKHQVVIIFLKICLVLIMAYTFSKSIAYFCITSNMLELVGLFLISGILLLSLVYLFFFNKVQKKALAELIK